jgi:hypothetical protein
MGRNIGVFYPASCSAVSRRADCLLLLLEHSKSADFDAALKRAGNGAVRDHSGRRGCARMRPQAGCRGGDYGTGGGVQEAAGYPQ